MNGGNSRSNLLYNRFRYSQEGGNQSTTECMETDVMHDRAGSSSSFLPQSRRRHQFSTASQTLTGVNSQGPFPERPFEHRSSASDSPMDDVFFRPKYTNKQGDSDGYFSLANVLKRQRDGDVLEPIISEHLEQFLVADDNAEKVSVYKDCFWPQTPAEFVSCPPIYIYPPSNILGRSFYTLVTCGLSGTSMETPPDITSADKWRRAEIMCYLPGSWDRNADPWPLAMLRNVAGYVIDTGNWISHGHGLPRMMKDETQGWIWPPAALESVSNNDQNIHNFNASTSFSPSQQEVAPYIPGSKLSHVVLFEQVFEDRCEGLKYIDLINEANGTEAERRERVNFLVVLPLTSAEARWKKVCGMQKSIYKILDEVGIEFRVINPMRPCFVNEIGLPKILSERED